MYRVIFDPGVLVSAAISPQGTPAKLVRAWFDGNFSLLACPLLFDELERVLLRQKFRRYLSEDEAKEFVRLFRDFATQVPDPETGKKYSSDPDDDYIVALAMENAVEVIVSGDPHLLNVKEQGVTILTPARFFAKLGL